MTSLPSVEAIDASLRFDYSGIDEDLKEEVLLLTLEAKNYERRSLEAIVGFGRIAARMQGLLEFGGFTRWLEEEFKLSRSMAYNFINVAKEFGDMIPEIQALPISLTVLYQIAEPKAPEEFKEIIIQEAKEGKSHSVKEAKDLKRQLAEAERKAREAEKGKTDVEDEVMELLDEQEELQSRIVDLEREKANQAAVVKNLERERLELSKKVKEKQDSPKASENEEAVVLEEKADAVLTKRVELVKEVEELELKLREMRKADKELAKRIQRQETSLAGKTVDQRLVEKKAKLESFRRKVYMVLSESVQEELLMASENILDEELIEEYKTLQDKFKQLAITCEKVIQGFAQKA